MSKPIEQIFNFLLEYTWETSREDRADHLRKARMVFKNSGISLDECCEGIEKMFREKEGYSLNSAISMSNLIRHEDST